MLNNFPTDSQSQFQHKICQAKILLQPLCVDFHFHFLLNQERHGSGGKREADWSRQGNTGLHLDLFFHLCSPQWPGDLQHPHPHLDLHHQVTSKEVNRPCSVREELNSNLALAGVLWGLVGCLLPSHLAMYTVQSAKFLRVSSYCLGIYGCDGYYHPSAQI